MGGRRRVRIPCGTRWGVRARRARVVWNSTSLHETSHSPHWSILCCGAKVALYDSKAPQGDLDSGCAVPKVTDPWRSRRLRAVSPTDAVYLCRLLHGRAVLVPSIPMGATSRAVSVTGAASPCRPCAVSPPSAPSLRRLPPQNLASRAFRRRPQPARVASETPGTHRPRSVGLEPIPSQSLGPEPFPSQSIRPEAFPSRPVRPEPFPRAPALTLHGPARRARAVDSTAPTRSPPERAGGSPSAA